jgi:hypothetical protein
VRWSLPLLLGAIAAFLLGAVLVLLALERQAVILAAAAILSMLASMVLFVLSIWVPRARVDWDRIRAEQRLWESGPLGRSWLRTRRRLYQLWKI